jgi:hypothetical protein
MICSAASSAAVRCAAALVGGTSACGGGFEDKTVT